MIKTLIHIGLYKTGSSFLADWFNNNPYIQSKQRSIAGFRSTFDILKFAQSKDFKNIEYFVIRDAGFTSLNFDNIHLDTDVNFNNIRTNAFNILKDLFNEPKILLIVRNKNDFLKSLYSQYIKEGGILTPEKMTDKYKNYLIRFFNYDNLINECHYIFGEKNVHVLPFEFLEQDALAFIKNIEDFLNISHFDFKPKKINKSLTNAELYWQLKITLFLYNSLKIFGKPGLSIFESYQERLRKKSYKNVTPRLTKLFCKLFPNKTLEINTDTEFKMIFENSKKLETFSNFTKYYE